MKDIDKFIDELADGLISRDYRPNTIHKEWKEQAKTQLLQLFDKSVEKVIKSGIIVLTYDDFVDGKPSKEIDKYAYARERLREEQRQTWNKIKSGEEKV